MKALRISLAILTFAGIALGKAHAFDCPAPRCVDIEVPAPGLTVPDKHVRILLPAGYDPHGTKDYPVLYLLHGAGDTYESWSENTDIADFTSALDLIIVMPDGGKNADAGWYSDWDDGSRQWESFHIGVVIPYIDTTYRTLGDGHRAVAGLSMGGFGAMHYAARHSGLFQVAASFSRAVDTMFGYPGSGAIFALLHSQYGTPNDQVWGNQITREENWRANNPTDLAHQLAGVKLLIATGNGTAGGAHEDPTNPGGYALEAGIGQMNLSFARALDAAGVPHTDLFYGPGQHSWSYWRDDLLWALPQILAIIQQ